MLLEIAIADAYAAGYEYTKTPPGPNLGDNYVQHPNHHNLKPGMYTDDTQMSIVVARCILYDKFNLLDFANSFLYTFKSDERDGYARGFQKFLENTHTAMDFINNIKPTSTKSGGAMRAGTIGLLPTIEDVLKISKLQASLTHNTTEGIAAAQGAALMVHHQVNNLGPIQELPAFLNKHVSDIKWIPNRKRTGQDGAEITRTALAVLLDTHTLADVLTHSVNIGGDTDTVATIAMAAASVSKHFKRNIDNVLIYNLENDIYGREFLISLDKELHAKFKHDIIILGPNEDK